VAAFLGLSAVVIMTPGQDTALTIRNTLMTLAWLSAYAMVVARAGHVLRRPRIRRAYEAVMGAILVAFGVRLAFDQA
jgi:threonine/homoserine/homoserine lactone efflux protein